MLTLRQTEVIRAIMITGTVGDAARLPAFFASRALHYAVTIRARFGSTVCALVALGPRGAICRSVARSDGGGGASSIWPKKITSCYVPRTFWLLTSSRKVLQGRHGSLNAGAQKPDPTGHYNSKEGTSMLRSRLIAPVIVAGLSLASPALAQSTVYIPAILELSGAGAVSGTNFRDGMLLAIDEINAKGGILGKKIETPMLDTQSDAGTSRAQVQKVLDNKPYVILGPVFSGSVLVDMLLTQQAEIPEIVGGEAAAITQKGNPYVFRTSFGQQFSMPKIANYMRDGIKAKTVAVLWVNNDFGKGGRDNFIKEMNSRNIKVAADISTESGQADFSADVVKLKAANADAIFVYLNEEESARFLREAKKQGIDKPLVGETTLLGQKVIDLAAGAANGVRGHVGLTIDAPIPAVQEFAAKFKKRFNYACDHNGIKGYTAVYFIKHVTEKIGKFDSKAFAQAAHGLTITPKDEPGILMEATWDKNGDIDRISFLGEVVDGKQKIVETLPKLGQ
jgi:branched-chain amino acid transport system substrate-binding protein